MKRNALTLAILASFSYPIASTAQTATEHIDVTTTVDDSGGSFSSVTVKSSGVWTGDNMTVTGSAQNLLWIEAGGNVDVENITVSNNRDGDSVAVSRTIYANGVLASGTFRNATIEISATSTNPSVNMTGTAAVVAQNGGTIDLQGGSVTATGSRRTSALLAGDGGTIRATGTTIITKDDNGHAVRAIAEARNAKTTHLELDNVSVSTEGSNYAVGIQAAYVEASVTLRDTTVTTVGTASAGMEISHGAQADVRRGSIVTNGNGAIGVRTYGGAGVGTAVIDGTKIETYGNSSYGVSAGDSIARNAGSIDIRNAEITTAGNGSVALNTEFDGTLTATNITATVQGENTHAAQIGSGGNLSTTDSTLVSTQGAGVFLVDNATVSLNGTTIRAAQSSLLSNLNSAGQSQIIDVNGASDLTVNNGTLLQVNRTELGMDGKVTLTLGAGSVSVGDIIDTDGLDANGIRAAGGTTEFIVASGASWRGKQQGLTDIEIGDDVTIVNEGNTVIAGSVTSGENASITFQDDATIGGDLDVGSGSTVQLSGNTTIGGDVITGGSASKTIVSANESFTLAGSFTASNTDISLSTTAPSSIGGNVELNDSSTIKGGSVDTPITVAGNVTSGADSVVGGNLDVQGSLTNSGQINPGNSVGVQQYGSIANLGSAYIAEVNAAGQSDLVIAKNGDVTLSNTALTVAQENGNGGYRLNQDYTILVAQNGNIVGNFASAGLDSSFDNTLVKLEPVTINAQDVKVRLGVDAAKVAVVKESLSKNQGNTLDGIVSVAGSNDVADTVLTSAVSQDSLNQLSGEIHASTQSALLYSSSQIRQALSDRMQSGNATQDATPLWAKVQGGEFSLKGDNNSAKAKTDTFGLMIGGDTAIAAGWRLGAAFGYTDGTTKVQDRASSKADVNSYTGALYGGKSWEVRDGKLDFLAGAAYTHHDIKTRRNVSVAGNQTLKADYNAKAAQVFTELGYGFNVSPKTQVGPFAGVAWTHLKSDSFDEKGGSAALSSGSRKDSILTTTLGVRSQSTFDIKGAETTLHASLGWRHASGDVDPSRSMSFITGAGQSFSIAGAPIAKDAAVLSVGATVAVTKNTTLGLGYNGQFGSRMSDNNGSVFMKIAF